MQKQLAKPAAANARPTLWNRIKRDVYRNRLLYLLALPGFLILVLFKIGPVGAMVIAFEKFRASRGIFGSEWVGLENFERLLTDPYILTVTKNTIILAVLSVVVVFPVPIIFSLFLN